MQIETSNSQVLLSVNTNCLLKESFTRLQDFLKSVTASDLAFAIIKQPVIPN